MQNNNSKALTSLALMETSLLSSDYLSTFLPFIATLTLEKSYESIDINQLVADFKAEYGIRIPRAPMQSILSKAVSLGLIEPFQDGRYIPVKQEMQKMSFRTEQNKCKLEIESILNNFIRFVKDNHNIDVSITESIDILMNFMDEYSPKTISGEYYGENVKLISNRDLYLMGDFIQFSIKSDISVFESIRKISMAYLITTALTFDEPVDKRVDGLYGVTLYLDTPIVLRLLGLHTEELERSYKEMFLAFNNSINPQLKMFQHTFDEVSGIIGDCSNWIDNPEYNPKYANPALLNFVKRNYSKIQVELYKNTLRSKLEELGIEVDEHDYYDAIGQSSQINSEKFEQKLIEVYKRNNPNYNENKNPTSLQYDVRSIENIVKLWKRKSSSTYSTLGYVFVTSNSTLAYVARKFTSDYWWDNKNHKSPCITDYYLGTMIWLSTPAEEIENVSKLKLLADCSAATSPTREVMDKFLYELEKLKESKGIKSEDYLLFRKNAYEKNYIQKLTLNEESAFKEDFLDQMLAQIKDDLNRPYIEELSKKEEQIKSLILKQQEQNEEINMLYNEKQKADTFEKEEYKICEDRAERIVNVIINSSLPWFGALVGLIITVSLWTPVFSGFEFWLKLLSSVISFSVSTVLALLKSNLFGTRDKLKHSLIRHYQIKQFAKRCK